MPHGSDSERGAGGGPRFRLLSGEGWRDPFQRHAALRREDPVHRVEPCSEAPAGFWVLSRHADMTAAATETSTHSSAHGLKVAPAAAEQALVADFAPMVMQDPPGHTTFRRVGSRGFTPKQVAELEPAVRDFVSQRLETIVREGGGDILATRLKPLPSMVVAHYLGATDADRATVTILQVLGFAFTMVTGGNDTPLDCSAGRWSCLGAASRLAARVTLEELLARCPGTWSTPRPRPVRTGATCDATPPYRSPPADGAGLRGSRRRGVAGRGLPARDPPGSRSRVGYGHQMTAIRPRGLSGRIVGSEVAQLLSSVSWRRQRCWRRDRDSAPTGPAPQDPVLRSSGETRSAAATRGW